MRKIYAVAAVVALAAAIGFYSQPRALWCAQQEFRADLEGKAEVPPVKTQGYGGVVFQVVDQGKGLRYEISVRNTWDVTMAHIHAGKTGANGDVIAWLYPAKPAAKEIPGSFSGTLGKGTLSAADLSGPLKGKTIGDLVKEMKAGGIYVNVHTKQNPDGELRGQVRPGG